MESSLKTSMYIFNINIQNLINNKIVTQQDIDKVKKIIKDKYNMALVPVYKIKDSMWI